MKVKTKEHSDNLRKRATGWRTILKLRVMKISKMLSLPKSNVQTIIQKFKSQGPVVNLHGQRRKRFLSARAIARRANHNPRITARKIVKEQSSSGVKVSWHTVGIVFKKAALIPFGPRRTPLLIPVHLKARLEFTKSCIDKDAAFWNQALWSDKTKIALFVHNSVSSVYRKPGEIFLS